tara:strand:- start:253 stop:579 length:327 start_codon:yes stop_codon:yes gene_type:complete
MSRKTTSVLRMLEFANHNLRRQDEYATVDFKVGICCMLEDVLHSTNNYSGFTFIDNNNIATGTLGYYSRQYFYSETMTKEVGGHLNAAERRNPPIKTITRVPKLDMED